MPHQYSKVGKPVSHSCLVVVTSTKIMLYSFEICGMLYIKKEKNNSFSALFPE